MINQNLTHFQKYLIEYIEKENYKNIVSVYVMGSSVRKQNFNDYDVNVFVKNDDFEEIKTLEKMKTFLEEKLNKKIDYNVIGMECVDNNVLNSDIFIHKNRHSMLLYEIITVKNLVYGEDILKNYKVEYADIIVESLNLAMTQVHRLNKEYLAKNKESAYKNARKYLKYTLEFSMIFSGMQNPYIGLDKEAVIEKYPNLKKYEDDIENSLNNRKSDLEKSYNCMVNLTKEMLKRFEYLVKYVSTNDELKLNNFVNQEYFSFKNVSELELFKKIYFSQEPYRRITFK